MYVRKTSIVSVEISRKWTDDFGTFWGHLRRSALQPLPQCTASALAVHCIRPCSVLHLFPHVFPLTEPKTCLAFVFPSLVLQRPLQNIR